MSSPQRPLDNKGPELEGCCVALSWPSLFQKGQYVESMTNIEDKDDRRHLKED